MELLLQVLEIILIPLTSLLVGKLIQYLSVKIKVSNVNLDNEKTDKYLTMFENTITSCVLATTQTYVEALKKEGKFTIEAQAVAFMTTKEAILGLLTEEAKKYLTEIYGDLGEYLNQRIEAEVLLQK